MGSRKRRFKGHCHLSLLGPGVRSKRVAVGPGTRTGDPSRRVGGSRRVVSRREGGRHTELRVTTWYRTPGRRRRRPSVSPKRGPHPRNRGGRGRDTETLYRGRTWTQKSRWGSGNSILSWDHTPGTHESRRLGGGTDVRKDTPGGERD